MLTRGANSQGSARHALCPLFHLLPWPARGLLGISAASASSCCGCSFGAAFL